MQSAEPNGWPSGRSGGRQTTKNHLNFNSVQARLTQSDSVLKRILIWYREFHVQDPVNFFLSFLGEEGSVKCVYSSEHVGPPVIKQ